LILHQTVQTVRAVRVKPEAEVLQERFKQDYFEIPGSLGGEDTFRTHDEWQSFRQATGKAAELE